MIYVQYKDKKRFIGNCEDNIQQYIVEANIASAQFGKHCSLETGNPNQIQNVKKG